MVARTTTVSTPVPPAAAALVPGRIPGPPVPAVTVGRPRPELGRFPTRPTRAAPPVRTIDPRCDLIQPRELRFTTTYSF